MKTIKLKAWCFIPCHTLVPKETPGTGSEWLGKWQMCEVLTYHIAKNRVRVRQDKSRTHDLNVGEECILLQFTGFYDDFGNEIYDKDVLKLHDKGETKTPYSSVVYMDCMGSSVHYHPAHVQMGETGLRNMWHYCNYGIREESECICEKLGNIYENKDLMSISTNVNTTASKHEN